MIFSLDTLVVIVFFQANSLVYGSERELAKVSKDLTCRQAFQQYSHWNEMDNVNDPREATEEWHRCDHSVDAVKPLRREVGMVEKVGSLLPIWVVSKAESTHDVAAESTESMI